MNKKNIENIYPLSPTQQGILFHTLRAPESGVYVVQSCYTFSQSINIAAFKQAWQQVINQHPILRTSFHWKQHKEPFQVVHKSVELPWHQQDWQNLSVTAQPEKLTAFLAADRQQGFDISQPSLMRLILIQIAPETYHFIWSSHHLILDGWSTALVLNQVFQAYEALCKGQVFPLPHSRPYQDYIAWLQQQNLAKAEEFWRKHLKGFTAPTQLKVNTFANSITGCGEKSIKLSSATTTALQSFARQQKLTLNTLIQGTWAILLSRYSGEKDIVFGSTSAGRPPKLIGSESMVGLFINTLPVRVQISGNELLIPWLQKLQAQQIEAQQYEYSPLVQVQGWSEVPRDLPLFETILVFENYPVDAALKAKATEMQIHDIRSAESTNYSLTLSVGTSTELKLEILYDRSRFHAETITSILGHLQTLLEGIVANPHQSLSSLPLLTSAEIHQQLVEWNNTQSSYPQNKCIHQLFEKQVEKTPDAVAVVFKNDQITYQQLNQKANQLAHFLQKLGVKPEIPVAICMERSLEMVIGVLGILKAGGAYVPLDPAYPKERLKYMFTDAAISVMLTQNKLLAKLSEYQEKIICLDTDWENISQESQANPSINIQANNLAYIIYTSGSTGKPKGVMIEHQSLINFTEAAKVKYQIQPGERILQFASISFDAAVEEIYPCLTSGATLVLRTDEMLTSLAKFMENCRNWQITVLDLPTAYWHLIVSELANHNLTLPESLRLVIIGGESAIPEKVAIWQQQVGTYPQLINTYGPTETTVVATYCNLTTTQINGQEVPIGCPINNVQIYLLDQDLQPLPVGIPGEIYIGGAGLARGYLHRPELTDEKFTPNPFLPDAKLYKTGDLARYLPNGNIQFIGRIDTQIKLRGFRIELGEIESVLIQHPNIQEAVVTARQNTLVGYIVADSQNIPSSSDIQNFLKEKLPEYMIPNGFIFLENLPLTTNGKIDHQALPAADTSITERKKLFKEARTSLEKELLTIWREILHRPQISIDENFFDLGGHSLLIVQLFARIRSAFQIDLPLQTLFEAPTIETLAAQLEIARQAKLSSTITLTNSTLDLKTEAVLDPTITVEGKSIEYTNEPTCIFITGATGFVGAFLLDELLNQSQAEIYCLVRANNFAEGKQKIYQALTAYSIGNESQISRIVPVLGDLSQPLLGLSPAQFTALAQKIDVIYHNGAWVHHTYPYSTLKTANVLGTQEVLRLASEIKIKPVHFISTISVFSAPIGSGVHLVQEQSNLDDFPIPEGGYTQSKWVAEQLINIASKRGLPVSIYRLGRVSGHSRTGVFNPNDFFYRLLIGCIQLGKVPNVDYLENLAPVDYVSKAIVNLSQKQQSLGKAFHLLNSHYLDLNMLFNSIREFGYPIQAISQAQWYEELVKIAENYPDHPLYPLIPFFMHSHQTKNLKVLKFDCEQTLNSLANSSIFCPKIDGNLCKTYISHLISSGLVQKPQKLQISVN
ncbi:MAG: hypothetical protein RLZZ507_283 [Cyanobacteriota bacterium]|jgi:amino acid adenylation domain-containing protein/thioester reductase-like protein